VRLLLDCDPGNGIPGADVDDGLAIAYALGSARAQLEAVSVVAGNTSLAAGLASAAATLRAAGREDVPVFAGAARPLVEDPAPLRAKLDGRTATAFADRLWRGTPPPSSGGPEPRSHAAVRLVEAVLAAPGEITLVALGPLTNVALACRLDERFASSAARIVVMGGSVAVPGIHADLNVGYDPEAASIVFNSGARIDLVPLDVTMQTSWTPADNQALREADGTLGRWLADTSEPWIRWVMHERGLDGCWLHDPLAVALALDDGLAVWESMHVDVELSAGSMRGAVTAVPADHKGLPLLRPPRGEPNVRVAMGLDHEAFQARFRDTLLALAAEGPPVAAEAS
jgi:inosine-uridine nucleoside N-ribohydrolase